MRVVAIYRKGIGMSEFVEVDDIQLIGENQDVIVIHGRLITQSEVKNWQLTRADWIVRIFES